MNLEPILDQTEPYLGMQIKVWNHAPLPISLEGKIVQIHSLQVTDFHSAQHDRTYKNIESLANVEIKVS